MKNLSKLFFFGISLSLLVSCFTNSVDSQKRKVRMKWLDYFIADLDYRGKASKLGTDSTRATFENKSDYKVDSVILVFENQGMLVHSYDTIKVFNVLPMGKTSTLTKAYKLGWSHSIKIAAIYSRDLEFCYKIGKSIDEIKGDCFHCPH